MPSEKISAMSGASLAAFLRIGAKDVPASVQRRLSGELTSWMLNNPPE